LKAIFHLSKAETRLAAQFDAVSPLDTVADRREIALLIEGTIAKIGI
jgi:hypothetical protein